MPPDKLPAHLYLDEHDIPYQRLTFPPDTQKGAANVSAALGYREDQMVKTLIFEAHTGERVLVLVGGNRNAISGLLKKVVPSSQRGQSFQVGRNVFPEAAKSSSESFFPTKTIEWILSGFITEGPIWKRSLLLAKCFLSMASLLEIGGKDKSSTPM